MSDNNEQQAIDADEWVKKIHGELLSYCSRSGLEISSIEQEQSAILPPAVGVWLVVSKAQNQKYWVITGDLPYDHIVADSAKNARDAIRHFVLRWQLKAENIIQLRDNPKTAAKVDDKQVEFAEVLINTANGLYDLCEKDELWKNR